jgi:hypothetical protein
MRKGGTSIERRSDILKRIAHLSDEACARLEEIILEHTRLAKEHFTATPERKKEIKKRINELVKERELLLGS